MFKEKRNISFLEMKEMYKKGERNFSNIYCVGADLKRADFSGCNFANSTISFADFEGANLSNCNFTDANLEWSNLEKVNFSGSNLTRTNMSWSVLNRANFGKALLKDTDMSWCLLFEVDLDKADRKSVNTANSAFSRSEVTKEGRFAVMSELAKKKDMVPPELRLEAEWMIKTRTEKMERETKIESGEDRNTYQASDIGKMQTQSMPQQGYGSSASYQSVNPYSTKKKKQGNY